MSVIVGISMPRCGHHFVERLLSAAYDGKYEYCDFYIKAGCCGSVPCKKNAHLIGDHTRVFYQKNHDVDLAIPRKIECDMRLVQYRNPLEQSIANFDNYVRVVKQDDSVKSLPLLLASNAWYYIRFFRKWIQGADDIFLLKYEDLTDDPVGSIERIASAISVPISEASLRQKLPVISSTGVGGYAFYRCNYAKHRFYDEDIFSATERILFNNCPGLDYYPMICRGPNEDALNLMRVLLASEAERSNPVERVRLLRRALEIRPDLPNVLAEFASALLFLGEKDEALRASEQALALDGNHPGYLHVRGNIAFAMGDYRNAEFYQESAIRAGGNGKSFEVMLQRAREFRERAEQCAAVR